MKLLEVERLHKKYGDFVALHDVSFEVDAGEVLGLLGPNGAGKSTAMMILAGLRNSDGGEIRIRGERFSDDPPRFRRVMGVVPQELAVYPDLTGLENLHFFGRLYGYTGADLRRRVDEALAVVGLTDFAGQYVRAYSGGMKRRLNFSVGILHDPHLVILDEPTVGVDPQSRSHLLECVRRLATSGVAVIYCSHYMEEIEALCQRVLIIDHGKMLAYGELDELLDRSRRDLGLVIEGWSNALGERLTSLVQIDRLESGIAQVSLPRIAGVAANDLTDRLAAVIKIVQESAARIQSVQTKEYTLERMFLEKTGRSLRD